MIPCILVTVANPAVIPAIAHLRSLAAKKASIVRKKKRDSGPGLEKK
jgi:hypothetical protein